MVINVIFAKRGCSTEEFSMKLEFSLQEIRNM